MYGSGDNFHGAMYTQMPYGMGENRHMLPPTARAPQPTPPLQFDLQTALALAAATVAASNSVNCSNGGAASNNVDIGTSRESDKLAYYSQPPAHPPSMQAGSEYSPSCYQLPPHSNSPADYLYYPRGTTSAGAVNAAAYYQTAPWQYPHQDQPPPPQPPQAYDQAVYGTRTGDTSATAPYDGRLEMNASPYMMLPNGNAAQGAAIGGTFEDLVDRFNCVNLNDAAAAVAQQSLAAYSMQGGAALFNAQWQQHLMGKTDTCAPPSGGGGMTVGASPATQAAPIGTSHPTSDRGALNRYVGGRFGDRFQSAGDISGLNGATATMELPPLSQTRAWATVAGVKSSIGCGNNNWTTAGNLKRLSQYDQPTSFENGLCLGDLGNGGGNGQGPPFRRGPHRPRVQKNGERPAPSAPRGVIRDGVYERITTDQPVVVVSTQGGASATAAVVSNELQSQSTASVNSGETVSALHDRLVRQINNPFAGSEHFVNPSARFFVIKSFSEDDIHRSIKYSIWCSTEAGNKKLNAAFSETCGGSTDNTSTSQPQQPPTIYLFFSVNGSGYFCGVAEMTSGVDYATRAGVWAQDKWQGQFSVKWIYVKDVPNMVLRHIHLETNDNKPVTHSRDTTEVPLEQGQQIMEIFAKYKSATSILDDFAYYEQREHQELNRRETTRRR